MLNDITEIDVSGLFSLNTKDILPYEKNDNTWISVTVEVDPNLMMYERSVYTVFDMMSDIGGLNGILMTICALICTTWNYNAFDNRMVQRLFKIKKRESEIEKDDPYFMKSDFIKRKFFPNFFEWFRSCVPGCFVCCKLSRKEKAM